jgi:hypothetical protein
VSRIEERIAAWTFLPEGEMKSEHSDRLLQFSSVQCGCAFRLRYLNLTCNKKRVISFFRER